MLIQTSCPPLSITYNLRRRPRSLRRLGHHDHPARLRSDLPIRHPIPREILGQRQFERRSRCRLAVDQLVRGGFHGRVSPGIPS